MLNTAIFTVLVDLMNSTLTERNDNSSPVCMGLDQATRAHFLVALSFGMSSFYFI